ncbi:MAG TPA: ATP-binding protein, partial [Telmatospirillum sp.]|nr:ATP-binding protein [Telmatospirillum sp.]
AVAVTDAVDGALSLLGGAIRSENISLEWIRPASDLRVWADSVRFQQVMINLLRNALDAMRAVAERRLSIVVSNTALTVEIAVKDSGVGITDDAKTHMFDPFFTTKPTGEGLGLGLSISEGIVRDFGGQLSAANHPDGGAVFTLTLRRTEAA